MRVVKVASADSQRPQCRGHVHRVEGMQWSPDLGRAVADSGQNQGAVGNGLGPRNVNRGVKGSAGLGRGPKDRFIHKCQPTDSHSGSGRGRLMVCAGDMPQAGNQIS